VTQALPTAGARPGRRAPARGFTLIEVLAALVIVALGMLGVIEAVTQTARNGTYLRDKTLAHWIAMNLVTEQRLRPDPPEVSKSSDELEFAGQQWRWTMVVTQTQVDSLRRMDVSVRRAEAPEDSSLTTLTGFYGAAIGAAGGGTVDWPGTQTDGSPDGDEDGEDDGGDDAGQPKDPQPVNPQPDPAPPEEEE
jgi:general secretion pathway protein I